MTRKLKFANADDMIDNCNVIDGCFIWKHKHGNLTDNPCLSPASPLSLAMQTNSVARILFIACRFLPASGRLIKWCTTKGCVNPYHHSESRKVVNYRMQIGGRDGTGFYTDLLPEQEVHRHLFPSPEIIQQVAPTRPATTRLLIISSTQAGFDCQKLPPSKLQQKISNFSRPPEEGNSTAPVLVLSSRLMPRRAERTEEEEAALKKESDDYFKQDIFAQIAARKKAKLRKLVDDWDTDVK
jgi:hypothetical protein